MPHDGYQALRSGAGVRCRTSRGLIALTGADRADYLQGLLTNDITALSTGEVCYAAYLTPQGRLVADMAVINIGDLILLDLHYDATASMVARLEELIFTEDVTVADWTATRTSYGVDGPAAPTTVARALAALGAVADVDADIAGLVHHRGVSLTLDGAPLTVVRTDELGVPGVLVLVASDQADRVHSALVAAGAVEVDDATAETVRVESGRPAFPVDMDSDTIPLEAGIEDRAISLTKGCYVGQEVIIRILHRGEGRVARRLVGLTVGEAGASAPRPGAGLWHAGQRIGKVTSATFSPTIERVVALGYVGRDQADPGTVVQVDVGDDRTPAVVTEVPFVPLPAVNDR